MKISKRQLRRIIKEEVQSVRAHSEDIVNMFLDDVIRYVRSDISSEQAPALAGMTVADFLQLAADRARLKGAEELISDYGLKTNPAESLEESDPIPSAFGMKGFVGMFEKE